MIRTTSLICVILIVISLTLSGCITPDVPEDDSTGSTPMTDEVVPTPTVTPTPIQTSILSQINLNDTVTINDTNDSKDTWDICDDRHNASHLYMNGCLGGSGSESNPVNYPVPEIATIIMVIIGLLIMINIARRK